MNSFREMMGVNFLMDCVTYVYHAGSAILLVVYCRGACAKEFALFLALCLRVAAPELILSEWRTTLGWRKDFHEKSSFASAPPFSRRFQIIKGDLSSTTPLPASTSLLVDLPCCILLNTSCWNLWTSSEWLTIVWSRWASLLAVSFSFTLSRALFTAHSGLGMERGKIQLSMMISALGMIWKKKLSCELKTNDGFGSDTTTNKSIIDSQLMVKGNKNRLPCNQRICLVSQKRLIGQKNAAFHDIECVHNSNRNSRVSLFHRLLDPIGIRLFFFFLFPFFFVVWPFFVFLFSFLYISRWIGFFLFRLFLFVETFALGLIPVVALFWRCVCPPRRFFLGIGRSKCVSVKILSTLPIRI